MGGGARVELSFFRPITSNVVEDNNEGEGGLRARGGRARAATWRSSVSGEVNNNLVNVEGV